MTMTFRSLVPVLATAAATLLISVASGLSTPQELPVRSHRHRKILQATAQDTRVQTAAIALWLGIAANDEASIRTALSIEPVEFILEFKGEEDGNSALHLAVIQGNEKIVKLLISKGANLNARNAVLITPLHIAAQAGFHRIAALLIQSGADIGAVSSTLETPLHLAPYLNGSKIIKVLLGADADLNARDLQGETPLHEASAYGGDVAAQVLIDAGADVNAMDIHGRTPMDMACQCVNYVGDPQLAQCVVGTCNPADERVIRGVLMAAGGKFGDVVELRRALKNSSSRGLSSHSLFLGTSPVPSPRGLPSPKALPKGLPSPKRSPSLKPKQRRPSKLKKKPRKSAEKNTTKEKKKAKKKKPKAKARASKPKTDLEEDIPLSPIAKLQKKLKELKEKDSG